LMRHTRAYKLRRAILRAWSTQLKVQMSKRQIEHLRARVKHTAARVMDDVQHNKRYTSKTTLYASLYAQASSGVPLHGLLRSLHSPTRPRQKRSAKAKLQATTPSHTNTGVYFMRGSTLVTVHYRAWDSHNLQRR
jgi:hypothetical protein